MYKNKEEYIGLYLETTVDKKKFLSLNAFLVELSEMVDIWVNSSSKPFPVIFSKHGVYLPDNDYSPEMASFGFQEYINSDAEHAKHYVEQNFSIVSEIENPFGAGKLMFIKNFINE